MRSASILVVDADAAARATISDGLRNAGHAVTEASSAGAALALIRAKPPDLLVCDCVLPDLTGFELLEDLWGSQELLALRVIMTSGRVDSEDIVKAFKSGVDDFVAKPVNLPELLTRVSACLAGSPARNRSRILSAGGICIDTAAQRVTVDGHTIALAPREYRLMLFLLDNEDRVFSRKQLLANVWADAGTVGVRTVDVHIRRLRSLLQASGYDRYFQTVRGSGYRFSRGG